jgi:hypothetical protein
MINRANKLIQTAKNKKNEKSELSSKSTFQTLAKPFEIPAQGLFF